MDTQNDGPWKRAAPALNMAIFGIYLTFLEGICFVLLCHVLPTKMLHDGF